MGSAVQELFARPPHSAKPWTRWWWFGSDIAASEVADELAFMASAGFGGVELAFAYGWPGSRPGSRPGPEPLTEPWIALVEHAAKSAHRVGLEFEMTFGSGWPFGGSHIAPAEAAKVVAVRPIDDPVGPDERSWAILRRPADGEPVRVVQALSPQRVKRAAPGQEGFVHDHLRVEGFQAHAAAWARVVDAIRPHLDGLFCDSWEVAGPYWTDRLPEVFLARHGYDLVPYLPFLLGRWPWEGDADVIVGVACDYRSTVSEMAMSGFYRPFREWCDHRGLRCRIQAHGSPTSLLESYGAAGVPETEALLLPVQATRMAASAAALYGTGPVTSESFTCLYGWPGVKMGAERPDDMKRLADAQFAYGLQRVSYHGFASKARLGRSFYAGSHINDAISWASSLKTLNAIFARTCALLQAGAPVRDLAVYDPIHDRWAASTSAPGPNGFEAETLRWPDIQWNDDPLPELAGYGYDWVNDPLIQASLWDGAELRIGRSRYKALVLPRVSRMPSETAEALVRLADSGAPLLVLGDPPFRTPGRRASPLPTLDRAYRSVPELERSIGLSPAVSGPSILPPFCHRRTQEGDEIFFLVHPSADRLEYPLPYLTGSQRESDARRIELSFRVSGRRPEVWNPATSQAWTPEWRQSGRRTTATLEIHPNEGLFVVFPVRPLPIQAITDLMETNPLSSGWRIRSPGSVAFEPCQLGDWSQDVRLANYSGTVEYECCFDLAIRPSYAVLDLGLVEVIGQATLNGVPLGERLWAPYRFDATDAIAAGLNRLNVRVTNLPFNALQSARVPDSTRVLPGLSPEEMQYVIDNGLLDDPLLRLPSGLFGPVRLEFAAERV